MIKTDDVEALISRVPLDSNQIQRRDAVAISRGILPGIYTRNCGHNCIYGISEIAEQHAAALVGIRLLSVLTKRGVAREIYFQDQFLFHHGVTEKA